MKMKRYKLAFVCFVALSILFFALPGVAQNGSLQIKCVDSSGNPAANVKIAVFSFNSQKAKDKKSDPQGEAEFAKLDDGGYRIVARKDGFAPAVEFAQVKGSRESVTLKLAAGADKKLWFEDPAEEQRAVGFLKLGIDAFKQNKPAEAEKLFSQSVDIDPSLTAARYYQAVILLQDSKYDQALEMLNKTAQVANMMKTLPSPDPSLPNNDQVLNGIQQLMQRMPAIRGENALQQKNFDLAIKEFSDAIKGDPNNPDYYASLAIALTNAKKFDEAITAVDKAIQLKPAEKGYATLKSNISARKENAEIQKAQAIMDEGKKLLQDGDAAGALKKFEESKNMVPQDKQSPLWSQIAKAQAKLNQLDQAAASYEKSIELAPADKVSDYRNAFAMFYVETKKYDEAVDVLTDPKALGSKSLEQTLLDLAKTSRDKEPKLAEAALERIIKTNPQDADVCFDLGQMYYADGKDKDSRSKELLSKYVEIGKDPAKIENAKNMLVMINRRTK